MQEICIFQFLTLEILIAGELLPVTEFQWSDVASVKIFVDFTLKSVFSGLLTSVKLGHLGVPTLNEFTLRFSQEIKNTSLADDTACQLILNECP